MNFEFLNQGVLSSLKKCGFMTFSPISVKMMRSANFSVAWMAVLNHVKCNSLQLSLRMKLGGLVFVRQDQSILTSTKVGTGIAT